MTGDILVAPVAKSEFAYDPSIAIDDTGNIMVTWMRCVSRSAVYDYAVLVRKYDSLGDPVGPEIVVNSSPTGHNSLRPDVASSGDGKLAVVWQDRDLVNRKTLVQYYASDGTPIGDNQFIPDDPYGVGFRQEYPNVAVNGSSVFMTWTDARRGQGYDIFAKRIDWPEIPPIFGDVNENGSADIDDVVALIGLVFGDNSASASLEASDVNRSGSVDIDDVVHLIAFIFSGE
jgi:hypothetical protein